MSNLKGLINVNLKKILSDHLHARLVLKMAFKCYAGNIHFIFGDHRKQLI